MTEGQIRDRLDRERLRRDAVAAAGSDDLGAATWAEGLDVLLGSLLEEARLNPVGVEVVAADITGYLTNRLAITAWWDAHPDVARARVDEPIVIVGQPRTGTTILYDLLAQDPGLRAPLTWEVDRPVPPPEAATYGSDPRIAEVQATLDMADALIPGFSRFHPMGALLGQECVRITAGDFRSLIFPTQYRVPSYQRWLLDQADLAPAYRWHRRFLQHLQSARPGGRWLLKSPAHLWHLPALTTEYPDTVIVQTHRDPLVVVASVSALSVHLRRMASDDPAMAEVSSEWAGDIFLGLERGIAWRDEAGFPPERIVDVRFAEFMADPIACIRRIYGAIDRELDAGTEQRMRHFLAQHPGDGGGSGVRYRFSDTGLDAAALRDRASPYQERFAVGSEPLS